MIDSYAVPRALEMIAVAMLGMALPAHAQQPGRLRIHGQVLDSLVTGRPLAGALVYDVAGTDSARTDSAGRFELANVAGGDIVLTFSHPLLDSLGLPAFDRRVAIIDSASAINLATPSLWALLHRVCIDQDERQRALLLIVRDGAGALQRGVPIAAAWAMEPVGNGVSISVRTASDSGGQAVICAAPQGQPVRLTVRPGRADSLPLVLGPQTRALEFVQVYLPAQRVTGPRATGAVQGVVMDDHGRPAADVRVSVVGVGGADVSHENGSYRLTGVPSGTHALALSRVGSLSRYVLVHMARQEEVLAPIVLSEEPVQLPTIGTTGRRPAAGESEFDRRRRSLNGQFLTAEDIERRRANRTEQLLSGMLGVVVRPTSRGYAVAFPRAAGGVSGVGCKPAWYVDGVLDAQKQQDENEPLSVLPSEIVGIEVYVNVSGAPPQYQRMGSGCGLVLVWTRRGRQSEQDREQ